MAILTMKRRRQNAWTLMVVSLAIVVLAVGGYAYHSADGKSSVNPVRDTAPPSIVTSSHEAASQTPAEASTPLRRSGLSTKAKLTPESKALEFEMAAMSNDSRVRFKAYQLAHDCAMAHALSEPARTDSWLPGRPSEPFHASACGDLKPAVHCQLRHQAKSGEGPLRRCRCEGSGQCDGHGNRRRFHSWRLSNVEGGPTRDPWWLWCVSGNQGIG